MEHLKINRYNFLFHQLLRVSQNSENFEKDRRIMKETNNVYPKSLINKITSKIQLNLKINNISTYRNETSFLYSLYKSS